MNPYVYKRRNDGIHIINLGKTWEKLIFAARIIAAIENVSHEYLLPDTTLIARNFSSG